MEGPARTKTTHLRCANVTMPQFVDTLSIWKRQFAGKCPGYPFDFITFWYSSSDESMQWHVKFESPIM